MSCQSVSSVQTNNTDMRLPLPTYSTEIFTIAGNAFVAEASDLGPGGLFGQIYDDACDTGLL